MIPRHMKAEYKLFARFEIRRIRIGIPVSFRTKAFLETSIEMLQGFCAKMYFTEKNIQTNFIKTVLNFILSIPNMIY